MTNTSEDADYASVVGRDWIEETLRLLPFAEWDRFTTGEWSEDSPYVTVYGWLPRDQAGYKDFVILLLWPETETVYFSTSSAERTEDIFEALYDEPLEEHNECQRVEDHFDVDNAVSIRTDGGEELESGLRHDDIVVTMKDGDPALKIGDDTIRLEVFVKVDDEDEPLGDRHLETRAESDSDDGAGWWNVTNDEGSGPYPWVTIQPVVE